MEKNMHIPPKYVACLLDMSEYCSPELLARCGGKVYLSGFYDDNLNTYICSFDPMIFVQALEWVPEEYPEEEPARNDLWEELNELLTVEDSDYYGRYDVERMRKANPDHFKELDFTFEKGTSQEESDEAVREELQGNPVF